MRILLIGIFSILVSLPSWAAHGYALWGELKYPENFSHFDYVNPQAPKGGELRMVSGLRVSTFDKFNPFTMKGNAPAYLSDLMFDSLLAASKDRFRLWTAGQKRGGRAGLANCRVQTEPGRTLSQW